MSLISNNKFRIGICWFLIVAACVSMMFVGDKASPQPATPSITETDQICISGALAESWMYVLTDKEFINEAVKMYESISYEESDQPMDMMTVGEVYCLTFSKGNEQLASFCVNKNGIFVTKPGTQPYKITSDFDFGELDRLIQKYSPLKATPDQIG